jgi:hypothetical protein
MRSRSLLNCALTFGLTASLASCGGANNDADTANESDDDDDDGSDSSSDETGDSGSDGDGTASDDDDDATPSDDDDDATSSDDDDDATSSDDDDDSATSSDDDSTSDETSAETGSDGSDETTGDDDDDDDSTEEVNFVEGLTLTGLEINQGIAIQVAEDGKTVPVDDRAGPLIADRKTLVRAIYDLDAGWEAKDVEGRFTLKFDDGTTKTFRSTKNISAKSDLDTLDGTLHWTLERDELKGASSYSVGLFLADGSTSDLPAELPRIPRELGSFDELGITKTEQPMRIEVVIVKINTNGATPDMSDAHMQQIRDSIFELNPVVEAEVTLRDGETNAADLNACLNALRSARNADNADPHVYYLGILEGPLSGLSNLAQGGMDEADQRVSCTFIGPWSTLSMFFVTHELGHAEGSEHTPGCGAAGTVSDFPHLEGGAAKLGVQGWSHVTDKLYAPSSFDDVMNYCDPQWISDYTWKNWTRTLTSLSSWPQFRNETYQRRPKQEILWGVADPTGNVHWSIVPSRIDSTRAPALGTRAFVSDSSNARAFEVPGYAIGTGEPGYQTVAIPLTDDMASLGRLDVEAFGQSFSFDRPQELRRQYENELAKRR